MSELFDKGLSILPLHRHVPTALPTVEKERHTVNQRFCQDLAMLLELELERNERVRAVLTAYEEMTEEEKALFRLAAGISQNAAVAARRTGQRISREETDEPQPARLQPLVRNLMKNTPGGTTPLSLREPTLKT